MKTKLVIGVGIIGLLALGAHALFTGGVAGLASVIASQNRIMYAECISTFSEASHNNFDIREVELNGDGRTDAFVQYTDDTSCGSAGCVYEICIATQTNNFEHVPFGYAAKHIDVNQTKTNDMYDLILNEDKNLKMIWDGTQYVLED